MNIMHHSNSFASKKKTIVTVGTFDGVHLGHQKIIASLIAEARKKDLAATLLTFDPHPRKVVHDIRFCLLLHFPKRPFRTLGHKNAFILIRK